MLRDLFRLICDMLHKAQYEDTCRGLYVKEEHPKTYGSNVRHYSKPGES